MSLPNYKKETTALRFVDPYNAVLSVGGKLGDRIKALAAEGGVRDNRTAVVTLGTEAAIVVIDLATRQVVQRHAVGTSPDGVAIHLRDAR